MKRKLVRLVSLFVSAALLLCSCSSSDSKKKKSGKDKDSDLNEEIVEVVDAYFANLSKFNIKKVQKSADNTAFAELDLSDEETDVMKAYLSKMSAEVTETNAKKKKATATVELTTVNLGKSTKKLDEDAGVDELIDAIKSKKATTATTEVDLSLVLEDDEWKIESDDAIYDLIMSDFECVEDFIQAPEVTTTTTEETTEVTTTTTEMTTVETPAPGGKMETEPCPGIVAPHILPQKEFSKTCISHGFVEDVEDFGDFNVYDYFLDPDEMVLYYIPFEDKDIRDENYEMMEDVIIQEQFHMEMGTISDSWSNNTHNIVSTNNSYWNGCTIDLYIYSDETTMAVGAILIFPQGDPSIDYYLCLQECGFWDFGIDG